MFKVKHLSSRYPVISAVVLAAAAIQIQTASAQPKPAAVSLSEVRAPFQSPADAPLVPACSSEKSGAGDGGPTVKIPLDGVSTDRLPLDALTTPDQPDLAISMVTGTLNLRDYNLSYCVINRGGKVAPSPITIRLQSGDMSFYELTMFTGLPALSGRCLAVPDRSPREEKSNMNAATLEVTVAPGELSLLNNKCRVQWSPPASR